MKIAICHNLKSGGAKRTIDEICKVLAKRHQLDYYCKEIDFKENLLFFNPLKLKRLFSLHKKVARKIDENNYDLVLISHDWLTKSPVLLRYLNTPSFYICHEPFREFYEPGNLFKRRIKHKIINLLRLYLKKIDEDNVKQASFVITNSEYSQKRLKEIYKRKVERIKLGVNRSFFKYQKKKREDIFLSVGAVALFKGMNLLIKAISFLPKDKRFPLYIVADGGRDEVYIKNLASKLTVDLQLKRRVNDKKLLDYYNKAQLFLFAPYKEPFGLVALEAMASGLPVVGVKQGGLAEIIKEDINGFLASRNPKAISKAILKGLKHVNGEFRNKTRNSTIELTWEATVDMLEEIFTKRADL